MNQIRRSPSFSPTSLRVVSFSPFLHYCNFSDCISSWQFPPLDERETNLLKFPLLFLLRYSFDSFPPLPADNLELFHHLWHRMLNAVSLFASVPVSVHRGALIASPACHSVCSAYGTIIQPFVLSCHFIDNRDRGRERDLEE